jgi:hypothetical protein
MNESPLKGDVVFGDLFSRFARLGVASAIENADRIGFELDGELLNNVLDGLFAVWNRDRALILARAKFALHEHVCAFYQTRRHLGEALSVREGVVPLRSLVPLAFVVLPGFSGRHGESCDSGAVWQLLGLGVAADESDDCKLIEVHECFSLSARLPGHPEASGGCSQTQ